MKKKIKKTTKAIIIAVVGMAGSGKTTVCAFLKKKGLPVLRFGDETDIGLREMAKQINEKNEKWYREKLRRELGMGAYAIKIKPRIEKEINGSKIVVLDGLYSWEEYVYLKKYFDGLVLLGVFAQPEIRYERLAGREVRGLTFEEAKKRDMAELINLNKGGPIAFCDYFIVNEGTKLELGEEVDRVYKKIAEGKKK